MAVSRNFSHLNQLFENAGFPQKKLKRTGEVVSIDLFDPFPLNGDSKLIASSKRKSWCKPVSVNAYWNYTNLRAEVVAWESRNGICRDDRRLFERCTRKVVEFCYMLNCSSGNRRQYFRVSRNAVVGGIECMVWLDDIHMDESGWGKPVASVFCGYDLEVRVTDMENLSDEEIWERRYSLLGLDVTYPLEI